MADVRATHSSEDKGVWTRQFHFTKVETVSNWLQQDTVIWISWVKNRLISSDLDTIFHFWHKFVNIYFKCWTHFSNKFLHFSNCVCKLEFREVFFLKYHCNFQWLIFRNSDYRSISRFSLLASSTVVRCIQLSNAN